MMIQSGDRMELIKCYEVQKEFGEQKVLSNVTMEIGQHEK